MAQQVYQGETGGYVSAPFSATIPAVSGFAVFVGKDRRQYRLDAIVGSGELLIAKSGIANMVPGEYIMLAQVIDASSLIYFLTPDDLEVIFVPNFNSALFVPGDSILTRLDNLESISQGYETYTAGPGGVQTAKLVALVGGVAVQADARTLAHAGNILGFSIESASAGDPVKVQGFGALTSSSFTLSQLGYAMVGYNGSVAFSVSNDFVFVEYVGISIGTTKFLIQLDPISLII